MAKMPHETSRAGDPSSPICCERLGKRYGLLTAFAGLDLEITSGQIVALVGPNGAGKSSLMGCLTGLLEPSEGAVRIWGVQAAELSQDLRARMGYVPQNFQGFMWFRVGELLDYIGRFYPEDQRDVWPALKEWGDLNEKVRVKQLSGGQRQRLAIILALRHRPDLLLLDEPVASLDPIARREFLQLLLEYVNDTGATVMLSSHILSDLEQAATRAVVLHKGRLLADLDMEGFRSGSRWLRREDGAVWDELPDGLQVLARNGDRRAVLVAGWDEAQRPHWEARLGTSLAATSPANLESAFLAMVDSEAS